MKRYRMTFETMGALGTWPVPIEDPDGEWVEYDDYLAAMDADTSAQNAYMAYKDELARFKDLVRAASAAERAATARQGPIECPCRQCQALAASRATMDELLGGPTPPLERGIPEPIGGPS